MPSLHLDRVRKHFGRRGREVAAVDELSLVVEDGEFLVLVGPSGCGKTTTLRLVAGLEHPDGGAILADGRDLRRVPPEDRDVAMVFQTGALYPHLSVRDNIAFPLEMRRVPRDERTRRVAAVAELLEIAALLDRRPLELSGGERQRVAIGRAIVREPAFLLLDEPFASLDPPLRARLRSELRQLHARRPRTSVHVTHDQEEALALGNRVAVMRGGRLRQVGDPQQVFESPADRFVASFVGMPPMNFIEGRIERANGLPALAPVHASREPGATPSPIVLPSSAAGFAGRDVVLGIRPTDLEPCAGEGPSAGDRSGCDAALLCGEVLLAQPLGDRFDVSLRMASGAIVTARLPARDRLTPGTCATLRASKLHLFEPGPDGAAIAQLDGPAPARG